MDERERSIIAAHEVGHAICGKVHGDKRKVEEISLFAHGEALGVTVSTQEDNDLPSESDLRARLVALMGGRAAEELLFHEVTGGAANDFEKANSDRDDAWSRSGAWVATPRRAKPACRPRLAVVPRRRCRRAIAAVRAPGRGDARDRGRSSTRRTPRRANAHRPSGHAAPDRRRTSSSTSGSTATTFDELFDGRRDGCRRRRRVARRRLAAARVGRGHRSRRTPSQHLAAGCAADPCRRRSVVTGCAAAVARRAGRRRGSGRCRDLDGGRRPSDRRLGRLADVARHPDGGSRHRHRGIGDRRGPTRRRRRSSPPRSGPPGRVASRPERRGGPPRPGGAMASVRRARGRSPLVNGRRRRPNGPLTGRRAPLPFRR